MKNKTYEYWANELIGFQGGNKDSKLWFCGLEYQAKFETKDLEDYISKSKVDYLDKHNSKAQFKNEKFNQALLKLSNLFLSTVHKEEDFFTKDGPIYKINLYPPGLNQTDDEYSCEIHDSLNIINKKDMRIAMLSGEYTRFEKLKKLVTGKSKVIICCSRNEESIFKQAFIGFKNIKKSKRNIKIGSYTNKKSNKLIHKYMSIYHGIVNDNDIIVVIVPFLSGKPSSPKSNELPNIVKETINFIKEQEISNLKIFNFKTNESS